jgi:tetratricopeptide (TPR) repeat protein
MVSQTAFRFRRYMVSIKGVNVGWLRFMTVQVVLLAPAFCLAAAPAAVEPNSSGQTEQEKAITLREVAQNWLQVGIAQSKRGLYQQAEESFLTARGYQEYLTAEEQKELEENLTKAHQASIERQAVLEHIEKAKDLLNQGQPIKARAHYEKVCNSPYLTEQERRQIAEEIKKVDVSFDKQRKELTELYNRSVELYRAGEIEKAREGFVEVARYGLLITPKGQTAEDYLIQIDSVLTGRLKNASSADSSPPLALPTTTPPAVENKKTPDVNQPTSPETELGLLQTGSAVQPAEHKGDGKQQAQQVQKETAEVAAAAEPVPQKPAEAAPAAEAKTKIIRTYTKAVVEDATVKVEYYISRGEFDKAVAAVRTATQTIKENRPFIGDELFVRYSIRLKRLADRIVNASKTS